MAVVRLAFGVVWCSWRMTKRSSPSGSGRRRRGAQWEKGYKVEALFLKPSLSLFGLVGRHRVLLPHPGFATGHLIAPWDHHVFSTSRHTLVLTFKPTSKVWGGMMWPSLETTPKTITVAVRRVVWWVELCSQALNRLDLHFEGAGKGSYCRNLAW